VKRNSRLNKKPKLKQQLKKRGVGEKKRKLKRQRRRSEPGKLQNAPKLRLLPTRNAGTRRGQRGKRRERGRNERGNWLPKRKKIRNNNRTCESFFPLPVPRLKPRLGRSSGSKSNGTTRPSADRRGYF
jgi:hypothetical protein